MLAAAAALLALAAQAGGSDDVGAKAVEGAPFVFAQACLLRLNVKQTPAAYAAGSDELGRMILADTPQLKGLIRVDGADGRGCRLTYTGDGAGRVWSAFAAFHAKATQAPAASCSAPSASADRLAAACVSTADPADKTLETRRADLVIVRSGAGAQGSVTASLTNVRP